MKDFFESEYNCKCGEPATCVTEDDITYCDNCFNKMEEKKMEIRVLSQGLNEGPKLNDLKIPLLDLTSLMHMTFCVLEGGMVSGEPSVVIAVEFNQGTVCLQTSLDKLITATNLLITMAETNFGWKRPEGSATLMPMSKEARKLLLESIKQELEEWDSVEGDEL